MVIFVTKKKLKYGLFLLTLSWIAISPPCSASAASPTIERVPALKVSVKKWTTIRPAKMWI